MNDLELSHHIAQKFHAGQKYGEFDYIVHIDQVRASVKNHFPGDERLLVVANLHDILEDTAMTEEVLRHLFDKDIVDAVVAITHQKVESRTDYLTRVRGNTLSHKVKMCDSLTNLHNSMKRNDMKRVKKYGEYLAFLAS